MKEKVFTFWEGNMPAYIDLCLRSWDFDFTLLTYDNLHNFTDAIVDGKVTRYTLPQIADYIRVHVLRDSGGYWLDADTIMIDDKLPKVNILGYPDTKANTIGILYSEPYSDMFTKWAEYQDKIIGDVINYSYMWDILGNAFTDSYLKTHDEIIIGHIKNCWPETYVIKDDIPRYYKYEEFYFNRDYNLFDLSPTNMFMLHNSWTPTWYKELSLEEVMKQHCTLSNMLREALI